jgi:hypothetical protein
MKSKTGTGAMPLLLCLSSLLASVIGEKVSMTWFTPDLDNEKVERERKKKRDNAEEISKTGDGRYTWDPPRRRKVPF